MDQPLSSPKGSPSDGPGVEAFLNNDGAAGVFLEFLESEVSTENLRFWLKVKEYSSEKTKSEERIVMARDIYDEFVKQDAPERANLDDDMLQTIEAGLESGIQNLFQSAQTHIGLLLKMDAFPRFKKSKYFPDGLEALEKPPPSEQTSPQSDPSIRKNSVRFGSFRRKRVSSTKSGSILSKRKSQVILEGHLFKRGLCGLWWWRRFFVMQLADDFRYYRSATNKNTLGSLPLRTLTITPLPARYPIFHSSLKGCAFMLSSEIDGRQISWILCAQTPKEYERWIDGLKDRLQWIQFQSRVDGTVASEVLPLNTLSGGLDGGAGVSQDKGTSV